MNLAKISLSTHIMLHKKKSKRLQNNDKNKVLENMKYHYKLF